MYSVHNLNYLLITSVQNAAIACVCVIYSADNTHIVFRDPLASPDPETSDNDSEMQTIVRKFIACTIVGNLYYDLC